MLPTCRPPLVPRISSNHIGFDVSFIHRFVSFVSVRRLAGYGKVYWVRPRRPSHVCNFIATSPPQRYLQSLAPRHSHHHLHPCEDVAGLITLTCCLLPRKQLAPALGPSGDSTRPRLLRALYPVICNRALLHPRPKLQRIPESTATLENIRVRRFLCCCL